MRSVFSTVALLAACAIQVSCQLPDSARCSDDEMYRDGGCYDVESTDTDTETDTGSNPGDGGTTQEWLGAPCTCEGDACATMGSPVPTGGTIVGCSNVPSVGGALLACLRTNASGLGPASYFANGYCSAMASDCTGDATLCASGVVGDYAGMTACPEGSALLSSTAELDIMGMQATVDSKVCVPLCTGAEGECRPGETDPLLGDEASQYQCCEVDGVQFCYDPRNLTGTETVEAF